MMDLSTNLSEMDSKVTHLQNLIDDLLHDAPVGPLIGGIIATRRDVQTGDIVVYVEVPNDPQIHTLRSSVSLEEQKG